MRKMRRGISRHLSFFFYFALHPIRIHPFAKKALLVSNMCCMVKGNAGTRFLTDSFIREDAVNTAHPKGMKVRKKGGRSRENRMEKICFHCQRLGRIMLQLLLRLLIDAAFFSPSYPLTESRLSKEKTNERRGIGVHAYISCVCVCICVCKSRDWCENGNEMVV